MNVCVCEREIVEDVDRERERESERELMHMGTVL